MLKPCWIENGKGLIFSMEISVQLPLMKSPIFKSFVKIRIFRKRVWQWTNTKVRKRWDNKENISECKGEAQARGGENTRKKKIVNKWQRKYLHFTTTCKCKAKRKDLNHMGLRVWPQNYVTKLSREGVDQNWRTDKMNGCSFNSTPHFITTIAFTQGTAI